MENFAGEPWAGECIKWGYFLFKGKFSFLSNVVLTRFFVSFQKKRHVYLYINEILSYVVVRLNTNVSMISCESTVA